jgi:hypothetical protein
MKGQKTGGRVAGTPNKVTANMRAQAAASGELPLEYMLRVMRSPETEPVRRDAMAKAAAPYIHPTLASVDHTIDAKVEQRVINADPISEADWLTRHAANGNDISPDRMVATAGAAKGAN